MPGETTAWGQKQALHWTPHLIKRLRGKRTQAEFGSHYYGKAINVTRRLVQAYDAVLAAYDLLLMPTLPMAPTPLPPADAPRALYVQRALEMIGNTAPFDITHHPAMTVPCGMIDGLPVGLMLIGKHFDEPAIYCAAYAFEQARDWKAI